MSRAVQWSDSEGKLVFGEPKRAHIMLAGISSLNQICLLLGQNPKISGTGAAPVKTC